MTDLSGSRVLIVDDEEEIVNLYEAVLSDDYDVLTATTGAEALSQADESIDLVILDRNLPDMTGRDVITTLDDRGLEYRCLVLSGSEFDTAAEELSFDEYATKPVSPDELRHLVASQL